MNNSSPEALDSMQAGREIATFGPSYSTGITETNQSLGISQEALTVVLAGQHRFIISKVTSKHGLTYSIGIIPNRPEENATLLGIVKKGETLKIGRNHQPRLENLGYLSRDHFELTVGEDGELRIHDLGSINGTAIDEAGLDGQLYDNPSWKIDSRVLSEAMITSSEESETINELSETSVISSAESNQRVPELLTDKEIKQFISQAIASNPLNSTITNLLDLIPKKGLRINGRRFAFSDFIADHSGRIYIVAFIDGDNERIFPRFFYKSNSDGGYRSCPSVTMGRHGEQYSKGGYDDYGGYVLITKPAEEIIEYLEKQEQRAGIKQDDGMVNQIHEIFNEEVLSKNNVNNFNYESSAALICDRASDNTGLYKAIEPGIGFVCSPEQARLRLETMQLPAGFMPDFNKVTREYSFKHALLGISKVTVHISKLHDRFVEWHVAQSKNGHLWIDKIIYTPPVLNSYGTYREVILTGALALKPLDYYTQVAGMTEHEDFTAADDQNYVSLQPTIDRMPWAGAYRRAQKSRF